MQLHQEEINCIALYYIVSIGGGVGKFVTRKRDLDSKQAKNLLGLVTMALLKPKLRVSSHQ